MGCSIELGQSQLSSGPTGGSLEKKLSQALGPRSQILRDCQQL